MTRSAFADEGGVSFWLPGNFGSLAAAPGVPGWAWATIYYHTSVSAGAGARLGAAMNRITAKVAAQRCRNQHARALVLARHAPAG